MYVLDPFYINFTRSSLLIFFPLLFFAGGGRGGGGGGGERQEAMYYAYVHIITYVDPEKMTTKPKEYQDALMGDGELCEKSTALYLATKRGHVMTVERLLTPM